MTIEATSPSRQVRGQAGTPAPTVKAEPTKSAIVVKLLSRTKGATLSEVAKATGWQPHSCRAFLTGLRKRGKVLVKKQRKDGAIAYRIAVADIVAETSSAAPIPELIRVEIFTMPYWFEREDQAEFAEKVCSERRRWLVTGAAGFIGSNLVESLVLLGQDVVGFDNLATGYQHNLDMVADLTRGSAGDFTFIEGDIRNRDAVAQAVDGIDLILHQAALGSVPRSIADPQTSHAVNVSGFLNMLDEARLRDVSGFVYAASSSTYGDEPNLPKIEERIGKPLSPYAGTKLFNEIYADIWSRNFGFGSIGLRYFNVFGPRQDPNGAYAAVIPRWIDRMIKGDDVTINGDGETSRDFCFVDNAVQANLRAALAENDGSARVFNVAVGERTTLNQLFEKIRDELSRYQTHYTRDPVYARFRQGDVRHSLASIERVQSALGYAPTHDVSAGLASAILFYLAPSKVTPPPSASMLA